MEYIEGILLESDLQDKLKYKYMKIFLDNIDAFDFDGALTSNFFSDR